MARNQPSRRWVGPAKRQQGLLPSQWLGCEREMEGHRGRVAHLLLLLLLLGAAAGLPSKEGFRFLSEESDVAAALKWQLVTRDNFTEHIDKHEYSLCIARVPWCGEGRSLMNGILRILKSEPAILSKLSLCSVNSHTDKQLSDVFIGGQSPSFTFFRQSTAFKYKGRLISHHVVSSARRAMSIPPEGLLFKHVNSSDQLRAVMKTTDIAVVLFDRCGWAQAQTAPEWKSDSLWSFEVGSSADYSRSFRKQKIGSVGLKESCLGGSHSENNRRPQKCPRTTWWSEDFFGCTLANLRDFQEVFRNLSGLAAGHVMTPHRARFVLVTEAKVAIGAGFDLGQGQPWRLAAKVHDFHRTPHFYNGEGDIEEFLASLSPLVHELEREVFWNETPSVVLFIDRSSVSHTIQEKSNAALNILRAVARHYDGMGLAYGSSTVKGTPSNVVTNLKLSSVPVELKKKEGQHALSLDKDDFGILLTAGKDEVLLDLGDIKGSLKGHRISLSLLGQINGVLRTLGVPEGLPSRMAVVHTDSGLEDRMPFDATTENVVTDEFLGANKEAENDNVRLLDGTKTKNVRAIPCTSKESGFSTCIEGEQRSLPRSLSDSANEMGSSVAADGFLEGDSSLIVQDDAIQLETLEEVIEDRRSLLCDWQGAATGDSCASRTMNYYDKVKDSGHPPETGAIGTLEEAGNEEILLGSHGVGLSFSENMGQKVNETFSFFFWDGDSEVKQKLTTSVVSPSLVVLHPQRVAHYVYPLDLAITKASVIEFLDLILCDKLERTTVSEADPPRPREQPQPPLLNDDFHETDGVPRVTVNNFEKSVFGFEELHSRCGHFVCVHDKNETLEEGSTAHVPKGEPWEKDVVVLFTTSWCGFCKRMELVFKEVHRAIRRYLLLTDTELDRLGTSADLVTEAVNSNTGPGLPLLLQMDCVLNDCSARLKHVLKEEVYPTLILFPSRKKSSPVVYHGAVTVSGLVSFLIAHGTASMNLQHLLHGFVRGKPRERPDGGSSVSEQLDFSVGEHQRTYPPSRTRHDLGGGETYIVRNSRLEAAWEKSARAEEAFPSFPETGGFLVATERLVSSVFQSSVVLVVSANAQSVWGVMINKPLAWDLVGLDVEHRRVLGECPLNYGGPSGAQGKHFFVMSHAQQLQGFHKLSPDIFFGGTALSADEVVGWIRSGLVVAKDIWLFVGTAVWGWPQLQEEIDGGFWQLVPAKDGTVQWPF